MQHRYEERMEGRDRIESAVLFYSLPFRTTLIPPHHPSPSHSLFITISSTRILEHRTMLTYICSIYLPAKYILLRIALKKGKKIKCSLRPPPHCLLTPLPSEELS